MMEPSVPVARIARLDPILNTVSVGLVEKVIVLSDRRVAFKLYTGLQIRFCYAAAMEPLPLS